MAKLGKRPITIPEGVKVSLETGVLNMVGPAGKLSVAIPPTLLVVLDKEKIRVNCAVMAQGFAKKAERKLEGVRGLIRSLINSRLVAVKNGCLKKLEVIGVGYQAEVKGKELVLKVGFSHPIKLVIPEGIKVVVEKILITISGVNPEIVGNFAARIRLVKPPEPYGGKGIRYQGEYVRHKVGKTAGAAGATGGAK
ncbi:MAG: 50S ribosomal protein L6 [Candidatus Omnitrophica bacterium]|nr:50S ribosomal protein L6 [Candidatus Omnitrophota bacterium]